MTTAAIRTARLAGALALLPGAAAAGQSWTQFARGPARVATVEGTAPALGPVRWIRGADTAGAPIAFVGQAGVVMDAERVYAIGSVTGGAGQHRIYAVRRGDGTIAWEAPVPAPILGSWSTPGVAAGLVYAATARAITAFDAASGAQRWQTMLDRNIVNASPLLTTDRGPVDRLFITDYDGFGGAGSLYCLNIDAFDAATNPCQPGQILWSLTLGGTSGNTPAYAGGVVYIACTTDTSGLSPGLVLAFDAGATTPPPPLWSFQNPEPFGFFGGVCIHGGAVYAASYALAGGQTAANMVKLDTATGALRWSVPCNRTDSTPVPLAGGLIALSGGIAGFGSVPSIELFHDDGSTATMVWDSALATWNDANANLILEPGEYLLVGGWTHQPVGFGDGAAAPFRLLAGAIQAGTSQFGPCTDLYTLDLSRDPADPAFIVEHRSGTGTTPAVGEGELYTVGAAGLFALGSVCAANCDGSTTPPILNVADFSCFLNRFASGDPWANCDGSTIAPTLNVADFSCFLNRFAAGCS